MSGRIWNEAKDMRLVQLRTEGQMIGFLSTFFGVTRITIKLQLERLVRGGTLDKKYLRIGSADRPDKWFGGDVIEDIVAFAKDERKNSIEIAEIIGVSFTRIRKELWNAHTSGMLTLPQTKFDREWSIALYDIIDERISSRRWTVRHVAALLALPETIVLIHLENRPEVKVWTEEEDAILIDARENDGTGERDLAKRFECMQVDIHRRLWQLEKLGKHNRSKVKKNKQSTEKEELILELIRLDCPKHIISEWIGMSYETVCLKYKKYLDSAFRTGTVWRKGREEQEPAQEQEPTQEQEQPPPPEHLAEHLTSLSIQEEEEGPLPPPQEDDGGGLPLPPPQEEAAPEVKVEEEEVNLAETESESEEEEIQVVEDTMVHPRPPPPIEPPPRQKKRVRFSSDVVGGEEEEEEEELVSPASSDDDEEEEESSRNRKKKKSELIEEDESVLYRQLSHHLYLVNTLRKSMGLLPRVPSTGGTIQTQLRETLEEQVQLMEKWSSGHVKGTPDAVDEIVGEWRRIRDARNLVDEKYEDAMNEEESPYSSFGWNDDKDLELLEQIINSGDPTALESTKKLRFQDLIVGYILAGRNEEDVGRIISNYRDREYSWSKIAGKLGIKLLLTMMHFIMYQYPTKTMYPPDYGDTVRFWLRDDECVSGIVLAKVRDDLTIFVLDDPSDSEMEGSPIRELRVPIRAKTMTLKIVDIRFMEITRVQFTCGPEATYISNPGFDIIPKSSYFHCMRMSDGTPLTPKMYVTIWGMLHDDVDISRRYAEGSLPKLRAFRGISSSS